MNQVHHEHERLAIETSTSAFFRMKSSLPQAGFGVFFRQDFPTKTSFFVPLELGDSPRSATLIPDLQQSAWSGTPKPLIFYTHQAAKSWAALQETSRGIKELYIISMTLTDQERQNMNTYRAHCPPQIWAIMRHGSFGTLINEPDIKHKGNASFEHLITTNGLVQLFVLLQRDVIQGEEAFVYYGDDYEREGYSVKD